MLPAVIWLALGLVLIAAEVMAGEFVLLMLGGGALAAAGVSFLVPDSPLVGGIVFAVASVLLLFAVRPALRRKLERSVDSSVMHSKALVGSAAIVIARVDGQGGRIKIGGELWSARTLHDDDAVEAGATVTVMDISGATALVVARD